MRAETGDLDVIVQQVGVARNCVVLSSEKLLLIVEARTPRQVAANLQILAEAMSHHVRRMNTFTRFGVMRAAGGVNVMVTGPPAELRGINPAFHFKIKATVARGDLDR